MNPPEKGKYTRSPEKNWSMGVGWEQSGDRNEGKKDGKQGRKDENLRIWDGQDGGRKEREKKEIS